MPEKELYSKINFPEADFKISVDAGKVSKLDNLDDFPRLFHEEIELKLFLEGSSTLMIDNKTIVASRGDIVVVNPYQIHSTVNIGEESAKYHLVMISLDFFERNQSFPDLRRIFIKERTGLKNLIHKNHRLGEIIKNIATEFTEKKDMYHNVTENLVSELILLLLREYKDENQLSFPHDRNIRYYEIIYPALRKIRNDYKEKISIDHLAELCNVSKFHFCRVFKEVTSVSAIEYQTAYRLGIADILFKNSDKSISEIAEECGFTDVCYFSRCYKKHRGISPKEKRAILSK